MSQQILFLGLHGEPTEINALWSDHNNIRHGSKIQIDIVGTDKDRALVVYVNGVSVASVPCSQTTQEMAANTARLIGAR